MKSYSLLFGLLILSLITITSCKKDYQCKCVDKDTNKVMDAQTYGNAKEKDATASCKKLNEIYKEDSLNVDCQLSIIE